MKSLASCKQNNNFKCNQLIRTKKDQMNNANLIDLMSQTRNYEAHRKKIAQIMGTNTGKAKVGSFDNKRIKVINTYYSNHDRASRYSLKSKQEAVQKQNDLILKKIIEVNNRRSGSLSSRYQTISHNSMSSLKKTMQNINLQNQKIAQKLVATNSDLRQQKLFESFKKHLERKQRIKKYEFDEEVGSVVAKKIKSMHKLKSIQTMRASYRSRVQSDENQER